MQRLSRNIRQNAAQGGDHRLCPGGIDRFEIMARIVVAPEGRPMRGQDVAHTGLAHGKDVQPHQHGPKAILFAHMVRPGAKAFLAAERHLVRIQQIAEEFPPRRRLKAANPQRLRHAVHRRTGGHRPRDALQTRMIAGGKGGVGGQHRQTVRRRNIDAAPHNHVAITVTIGCRPEIGRVRAEHPVHQRLGPDRVGIGVQAAEIRQGRSIDHRAGGRPQPGFQNLAGVGPGHGAHRIKAHPEATGEHGADRRKIEQCFHQRRVIRDGIDHIHDHLAQGAAPDPAQIHVLRGLDAVLFQRRCAVIHGLRDRFRRGAAVGHVELQAEIPGRAAGVVAG